MNKYFVYLIMAVTIVNIDSLIDSLSEGSNPITVKVEILYYKKSHNVTLSQKRPKKKKKNQNKTKVHQNEIFTRVWVWFC